MSWLSLAGEDLGAVKRSLVEHVHTVSIIAFFNHDLASFNFNFFNCVDDHGELAWVQGLEHEGKQQFLRELLLGLLTFGNDLGFEVLFLVVSSKYFS